MIFNRPASLFLLVIFTGSCTAENQKNVDKTTLPHEIYPAYTAILATELNHDPDQMGFGQLLHIEMNRNGEFFILDVMGEKIHRFDKEGNELSIFQRSGRGPGEFLSMNLKIEDQLEQIGIYDPALGRITLMDTELELVLQTTSVDRSTRMSLELLGFTKLGAFFKGFKGFTPFNYQEPRELHIYFQEFSKEEVEHLLSVPITDMYPTVDQRSVFLDYKPLGRRTTFTKRGDELIYISNEGFGYTIYNLGGSPVYSDSLLQNISPYRFNEQLLDKHITHWYSDSRIPESKKKEILNRLRAVADLGKPVFFQNSFVDVQGRLWFELYPELFENESRWIVWNRDAEDVFQVLFEEDDVRPQNAIDTTVVAFKKNEFGLETVRIYIMDQEL